MGLGELHALNVGPVADPSQFRIRNLIPFGREPEVSLSKARGIFQSSRLVNE
jgi:hypothetical protein